MRLQPKTIRLPEDVWRDLEAAAVDSRRSLNGTVWHTLEQWLASRRRAASGGEGGAERGARRD